ncbi:LysM peptidoglycan-binding domain-containing protein [Nitratireductor sp. XY-223]|uniref:LysM peptidoglycan-binding domain-containing protein n=1 Tax=Nitratireductor sp. XY-223 TaxID=2561926 RepID=UPI001FED7838|nr:LysM peptidoglycan-binding domain-containing protein [Nitratireductor sp. XY-223]
MKKNKSLIWALVGLLIIIIVGVYVYQTDPFAEQGGTETAQQGETGSGSTQTGGEEKTAAAEPASDENAAETAAAGEISAPTFDVVRVEPNGSTLIAGQATPGTEVEIVSSGQVIAKADAGASGDFVAVVDDALEPGDHQIVLRSVGEGDASAQSEEVATISVPKDDPAELLVMVTKPGEASRILTKPETEDAAGETAAAKPEQTTQETGTETSAAETPAEKPEETQVAAATGEQAEPETAMAKEPAAGETATEAAPAAETQAAASSEAAKPEAGDGETSTTGSEVAAAPATATEDTGTETAMLPSDTAADETETEKSSAVAAAPQTTLRIDAVEIEDGRIFVAGSATPGGEVRVYADGEPIGQSAVSTSGRFLVEASKDLAVGDHIIGADLIMQEGDAPSLRVAVPFTRPEGQMVAAVASSGSEDSAEKAPESAAAAGGSAATEAAEKTAAEQTGAAGTTESPETEQAAQGSEKPAEMSDSGTAETASDAAPSESEPTTQTAQTDTQTPVVEEGSAEDSAAGVTDAADESTVVASAEPQDDATPTVVQPALEPRDSSVIIRRGDTLWQISRRIYGRGVRYTTIYLANTDQIRNPDKIEPGQIFMVPDEPLDNAEELHRQRIRGR